MTMRQRFDEELKKEIAQGYWSRTLSHDEIEGRGIKMGNVHRWVRAYVGTGRRPPKQAISAPPSSTPASTTAAIDIQGLSKRKIKRLANGRYPNDVKEAVMPVLLQMSVGEVSAKTGINAATLYLWRKDLAQKNKAPSVERANGGSLVVAAARKDHASRVSKAELLFSPDSIDAQMEGIRKGEGLVNIVKASKELKAAYKSGQIEDFDEIDLRLLLGVRQLTGAPLRMRK